MNVKEKYLIKNKSRYIPAAAAVQFTDTHTHTVKIEYMRYFSHSWLH